MTPALRAGLVYWAVVFTLAFGFGVIRTLWLAPALGQLAAVAIEVPLILIVSWLAATRLTERYRIASTRAAVTMGLTAFVLLMLSELARQPDIAGRTAWPVGTGPVRTDALGGAPQRLTPA
jgi:hypothetical protein